MSGSTRHVTIWVRVAAVIGVAVLVFVVVRISQGGSTTGTVSRIGSPTRPSKIAYAPTPAVNSQTYYFGSPSVTKSSTNKTTSSTAKSSVPLGPLLPSTVAVNQSLATSVIAFEQIFSSARFDRSATATISLLSACHCSTASFISRYTQLLSFATDPTVVASQQATHLVITIHKLQASDVTSTIFGSNAVAVVHVLQVITRDAQPPSFRYLTDTLHLVLRQGWRISTLPETS
jgi:hypothetical protein